MRHFLVLSSIFEFSFVKYDMEVKKLTNNNYWYVTNMKKTPIYLEFGNPGHSLHFYKHIFENRFKNKADNTESVELFVRD